jgi:hypothetical protein
METYLLNEQNLYHTKLYKYYYSNSQLILVESIRNKPRVHDVLMHGKVLVTLGAYCDREHVCIKPSNPALLYIEFHHERDIPFPVPSDNIFTHTHLLSTVAFYDYWMG